MCVLMTIIPSRRGHIPSRDRRRPRSERLDLARVSRNPGLGQDKTYARVIQKKRLENVVVHNLIFRQCSVVCARLQTRPPHRVLFHGMQDLQRLMWWAIIDVAAVLPFLNPHSPIRRRSHVSICRATRVLAKPVGLADDWMRISLERANSHTHNMRTPHIHTQRNTC